MGVKDLKKLKKNGRQIGDLVEEFQLEGRVGVDAYNILLRALLSRSPALSYKNKITKHFNSLIFTIKSLGDQLWVFDNGQNKHKLPSSPIQHDIFEQITFGEAVQDLKDLLDALDVPWILCPRNVEAEFYIVELKRMGFIDHIFSYDTDILALGEDVIFRKNNNFAIHRIKTILSFLDVDQSTFRKMCCMMGTDFNPRYNNTGPGTAYRKRNDEFPPNLFLSYYLFSSRIKLEFTPPEPKSLTFSKKSAKFLKKFGLERALLKLN